MRAEGAAVPGIRTEPLIDLLAGVPSMDDAFAMNHHRLPARSGCNVDLVAHHPDDRDACTEGSSACIASVQKRGQRPPT